MKITVDFDCTPEEARRLAGLPDLTGVHEVYLAQLRESVSGKVGTEAVERMMKSWMPMGEAGMQAWAKLMAGTMPGG